MGLIQAKNIQQLIEEWDLEISTTTTKAPATEVSFSDDPIALSWASYGVWKKFPDRRWVDLKDVMATSHDREIAQATRRYYADKLLMQTLKGQPLSQYQTALYGVVSGTAPILSDQIGLIMKLPYFYVQDTTLDNLCKATVGVEKKDFPVKQRRDTITPLTTVFVSQRRAEMYQHWFENSKGEMTLISVSAQNPLRSFVSSIFKNKQPIEVEAVWHYGSLHRHDRLHWNLANVEIV